jgi:transposase-like protein
MLRRMVDFLEVVDVLVARRHRIMKAAKHNPCPKCKSPQVELIGSMKVGRWKCRSCKHKWVWEPIKLIRSDSN